MRARIPNSTCRFEAFRLPRGDKSSWLLLFLLASVFPFASISAATELLLRFTDEEGQTVQLSKGELLLVAWGAAERLGLEVGGSSLLLSLDETWLRSRWPDRVADMEKVYLYLQADGYAAIRSKPFLWIGAHGPPYGPRVTTAEIAFPSGRKVVVQEGATVELALVFRRPRLRYLRLVDDHGDPIPGVKVESYMFWSASNHCGFLAADPLGEAMSNQGGRVRVSDGDFEYAFLLKKRLYVLKNAEGFPYNPPRLVTYLNAEETTVEMHRWHRRPLEMRGMKDGKPLVGQVLFARLAGCPCGTCSGPIAQADKKGMIRLPDFYPEQWDVVFFQDDNGVRIWEADPTEWPRTGIIHIELEPKTACSRPLKAAAEVGR